MFFAMLKTSPSREQSSTSCLSMACRTSSGVQCVASDDIYAGHVQILKLCRIADKNGQFFCILRVRYLPV